VVRGRDARTTAGKMPALQISVSRFSMTNRVGVRAHFPQDYFSNGMSRLREMLGIWVLDSDSDAISQSELSDPINQYGRLRGVIRKARPSLFRPSNQKAGGKSAIRRA
jgi:hypothetical protein